MILVLLLLGNIISLGALVQFVTKTSRNRALFNELKYLIFFGCGWIVLSVLLGTSVLFDRMEHQLSISNHFKVATAVFLGVLLIGSGILNVLITIYGKRSS